MAKLLVEVRACNVTWIHRLAIGRIQHIQYAARVTGDVIGQPVCQTARAGRDTPAAQRRFGYYALPVLWHDQVIGWANLSMKEGRLTPQLGHPGTAPRGAAFRAALDDELERMNRFLAGSR